MAVPVLETVFIGSRPTARHLRKGRLVVVDGAQAGRSVDIARRSVRVGRSSVCDLTLDDASVSGLHFEIEATEDGVVLRDLGSTNGTKAGGVRIREAILVPGATFQAGNIGLRYETLAGVLEIPLADEDSFAGVIGSSIPMREMFATLSKVAPSELTVLIEGETGTGKEVVARAIHASSRRAKGPFVVLDCSAIPATLAESTLFGHEQGAFTGAVGRHKGAFEQANGGTVFLDEIGELPLTLQPKLLRVLETQEVKRVGGSKTIQFDARLVAATNRDLRRMVAEDLFREDLFFRLSVIHVDLPPLRDRLDDIPALVRHFLQGAENPRFSGEQAVATAAALARLGSRSWPGNVRELRNVVERTVSLADGPSLGVDDFFPTSPTGALRAGTLHTRAATTTIDLHQPFKQAKQDVVDEWERRYLDALVRAHQGNLSAASRAGGLTRYHLRELLKKHGLAGRGDGAEGD